MSPGGLIRPSVLNNVTTAPLKHETKTSVKKDLKTVHRYVFELEREHQIAFGELQAELLAEKAKVQTLEKEAARSTLQAEKNKVKALEKEAKENDKEWMDLRIRFTRKVKQGRRTEWNLEDTTFAIAQLRDERDCALDKLKTQDKKAIAWMHKVTESAKQSSVESQENPLYLAAQDDILQSIQEKLQTKQAKLIHCCRSIDLVPLAFGLNGTHLGPDRYNARFLILWARRIPRISLIWDNHKSQISKREIKMDAMKEENLRLRKRLAVVITEADEAIRTTREVTAKNNQSKKGILLLEKKEPGLYFDGLETVAAFESTIAVLEIDKAQLALEKFEIIGDLAKAMQELRIAKGLEGPVGIRALIAASARSDAVKEAQ